MEISSQDLAFTTALIHAETKRKYDPVKRREYYLKTRQLKGRKNNNPSKAETTFRAGERKFGKAELDRAAKQIEQRVGKMMDKMLNEKKALDKLEKAGQTGTPEYKDLLAQYIKTLRDLSLNDPDATWTDSKRVPEANAAEAVKKVQKKK